MKRKVVLKDLDLIALTMTVKIRECRKDNVERLRDLHRIRASILAAKDVCDSFGEAGFQKVLGHMRIKNALINSPKPKQQNLF